MPGGRDSNPGCDQIIFLFDIFGLGVWYGMAHGICEAVFIGGLGSERAGCVWVDR